MTRIICVVAADAEGRPPPACARPTIGGPMDDRPRRNSEYESMHPPSRPYPVKKTRLWGSDRGDDE